MCNIYVQRLIMSLPVGWRSITNRPTIIRIRAFLFGASTRLSKLTDDVNVSAYWAETTVLFDVPCPLTFKDVTQRKTRSSLRLSSRARVFHNASKAINRLGLSEKLGQARGLSTTRTTELFVRANRCQAGHSNIICRDLHMDSRLWHHKLITP